MVDLEDKFIDLAFAIGPMEDLTASEVKTYIRYITDRRLISLGLKGIFKVKRNPLLWVEEMINAPTHTNFFENRATDYARGALSGKWDDVWGGARLTVYDIDEMPVFCCMCGEQARIINLNYE